MNVEWYKCKQTRMNPQDNATSSQSLQAPNGRGIEVREIGPALILLAGHLGHHGPALILPLRLLLDS